MIVVLTGGTGGAKFVDGLRRVVAPEELTVIVNTGDDSKWWGLDVSPDIDSIIYMLSDTLSVERGWGVSGDTFHCLQTMKRLGEPAWFSVGDRDLAVHLLRTRLLSEGGALSGATKEIAQRFGVRSRILPMTDHPVHTMIETPEGEISFEEYFVKRRFQDPVVSVRFEGATAAKPAHGVLKAIASAEAILIAPSNPVTSIGPILAVPEIRKALVRAQAPIVAISPIIGTAAVSGPAGGLMKSQGWDVSIRGVVRAYGDFLDVLVVHSSDTEAAEVLKNDGVQVHYRNILMKTTQDRTELARAAVSCARSAATTTSLAEAK